MDQLAALRTSVNSTARNRDGFDDRSAHRAGVSGGVDCRRRVSHLGSGAVIMHRRLDAQLAGQELADDERAADLDEWNAKNSRRAGGRRARRRPVVPRARRVARRSRTGRVSTS